MACFEKYTEYAVLPEPFSPIIKYFLGSFICSSTSPAKNTLLNKSNSLSLEL